MGQNPAWDMGVYLRFSCVNRGLDVGRFLVQGVLLNIHGFLVSESQMTESKTCEE
jgi:hypothetical protein